MRTIQHITDSNAIKKVINAFPEHWVIRELSERDYGIDLVIEIFTESGSDDNGNVFYESTGDLVNIQVKGKKDPIKPTKEKTINFPFGRKNLLYCEKFAIPFILLVVDTSNDNGNIYHTWIQKYIKKRLDIDHRDWRTESRFTPKTNKKIKNPTYQIRIPEENILSNDLGRIEGIAKRIKYIEELSEYIEIFSVVERLSEDISTGAYEADQETYDYLVDEVRKISFLNKLIQLNNCNISHEKVRNLLFHFMDIKATGDKREISKYPHKEEFIRLLGIEILNMLSTEDLEEQMCGRPPY